MKEFDGFGIDSSVQQEAFVVEVDYGFIDGGVIRVLSIGGL